MPSALEVTFRPEAEEDLLQLYDYIAERASRRVAENYVGRIEAACMSLNVFPERGTAREDLGPRIRTFGFERRATIVFRIEATKVVIVRVLYGDQDVEAAFRDGSPDGE